MTTDMKPAEDACKAAGLEPGVAEWIRGTTPEDLNADAQDLADALAGAAEPASMNDAIRSHR